MPLFSMKVHLEPYDQIAWAYQLHYDIRFRTHRRRPHFSSPSLLTSLSQSLEDLCELNEFHLLDKKLESQSSRLLLSLRPEHTIANVLKTLKGRSSSAMCAELAISPPLWARGYLAESVGRVRIQAVKNYISGQSEHHGYAARKTPPIYCYKAEPKVPLTTAHSFFDLTHHVVLATKFRRGVFAAREGKALIGYWNEVGKVREFAIDRATVLPEHIHMIVRITPKTSVERVVLSLMNNGQYFVGKHFPDALVHAGIDQMWQPSAYAATCGELSTALLKAFLRD
jgi:putative transposase